MKLLPFLKQHGESIRQSILAGEYTPKPVSRVEIPKPDWGVRLLGIPTVLDRFYFKKDGVGIRVHEKSIKRFKAAVRELTSKSDGSNIESKIMKLKQKIPGWVNYFGIADMKGLETTLDEWIRRRLRRCYWKQWKKIRTKFDNLVKLGIDSHKAWEFANTRKGYWRISNSPILSRTLTNALFEKLGYPSILKRYLLVH